MINVAKSTASAVGIIGSADGLTTIYLTSHAPMKRYYPLICTGIGIIALILTIVVRTKNRRRVWRPRNAGKEDMN